MNSAPGRHPKLNRPTYRTIGVSGERIRVMSCLLDVEARPPPLLVFNGIGADAQLLQSLLVAVGRPVLTFDLPGIGGSDVSWKPRRMNHLASLAGGVLDELNISRVHVLGISWGGALAQQFAHQFGDRCDRLILAATSTGHLMVPPRFKTMWHMATPMRYYNSDYFKWVASDIYGGDFRSDKKLAARHARKMSPPSLTGYLMQLFAGAGWTSLFWLHRLQQRTLIMAGSDDPVVRPVNARILAARIPNSTLRMFDCGHLFMLTRMDDAVSCINEFLDCADTERVATSTA